MISIIGLGYVGLPLALQFARSGVPVLGLDIDQAKVSALNRGQSYIKHIPAADIAALVNQGMLSASTDFSRVREVEAVIICVPTPLKRNREPDISYILNTARAIAPYLGKAESGKQKAEMGERKTEAGGQKAAKQTNFGISEFQLSAFEKREGDGQGEVGRFHSTPENFSGSAFPKLIVLESTTYPGTTEEELRKVLEAGTGEREEAKDNEQRAKGEEPRAEDGPHLTQPSPLLSRSGEGRSSPESHLQSPGSQLPSSVSHQRWVAGRDFHLAFSPEREDPGNPNSKVADIPKIVGGYTPACLERAVALYSRAIKTVVPVSSCRVAEATKLLENIFRSVNIALVNELKVVYSAMGIDIWEVIEAAKTKPFGFMPFYPGPGLGGHCIPIDPFYLAWKARQCGQETRFIQLAGEINTAMPQYVVARVAQALEGREQRAEGEGWGSKIGDRRAEIGDGSSEIGDRRAEIGDITQPFSHLQNPKPHLLSPISYLRSGKSYLRGAKILLLGLAYKPDVDDDRESPTYILMDLLKEQGADVAYYDPHVPAIRPSREHSHWAGTRSVEWNQQTITSFDLVLICTAHKAVNYEQLAQWANRIVDTRNVMHAIPTKPGQVWKA